MGQQYAFVFIIILVVMIFSQIIILSKNQKNYYTNILNDIKLIKEKLDIK